nr:hypothetical protein [Crepidula fornicata]
MKSLCMILVSLVAGVCHAQSGKYSACNTITTITNKCADDNLPDTLKTQDNMESFESMKVVSELDNAGYLLKNVKLDIVCNDSPALEKYFVCAFGGIGTCLEKANSSQVEFLPDVGKISKAIVSLCSSQPDMNITCLQPKVMEVQDCLGAYMRNRESTKIDVCETTEELLKCAKLMSGCDGGDAVEAYIQSAQPASCMDDKDSSGACQYLASSLILGALLLLQLFQ